jgi:hypothetical protein
VEAPLHRLGDGDGEKQHHRARQKDNHCFHLPVSLSRLYPSEISIIRSWTVRYEHLLLIKSVRGSMVNICPVFTPSIHLGVASEQPSERGSSKTATHSLSRPRLTPRR